MYDIFKRLLDEAKSREIPLPALVLVVDPNTQRLDLYAAGTRIKTYTVSTSKFGRGGESGSYKTPTGFHAVADRIGRGEPAGRIFESRIPLPETFPLADPPATEADLILTRILRLRGLEAGNARSYDRYIYIHGTNQEHLLGTAASHGCIRMRNSDIIELFDRIGDRDAVCWIAPER